MSDQVRNGLLYLGVVAIIVFVWATFGALAGIACLLFACYMEWKRRADLRSGKTKGRH
jgi:hypothetical protein